MRELDVLLTAWLDTRFAAAAEDEQQAFCQLLALADDELIDYLLGGNSPSNPVLARVVREIRLPSPR